MQLTPEAIAVQNSHYLGEIPHADLSFGLKATAPLGHLLCWKLNLMVEFQVYHRSRCQMDKEKNKNRGTAVFMLNNVLLFPPSLLDNCKPNSQAKKTAVSASSRIAAGLTQLSITFTLSSSSCQNIMKLDTRVAAVYWFYACRYKNWQLSFCAQLFVILLC